MNRREIERRTRTPLVETIELVEELARALEELIAETGGMFTDDSTEDVLRRAKAFLNENKI
jgi:hypothetical protein